MASDSDKQILQIYDDIFALAEFYRRTNKDVETYHAIKMLFTVLTYEYIIENQCCIEHGMEEIMNDIIDCMYEMHKECDD